MNGPSPLKPEFGSKFFAVVLMAVGALICVLCGLCTAVWFANYGSGQFAPVVLSLIFGGVPICIGAAIVVVGFRLYRQP